MPFVDDEWIAGEPNSAPPHVCICLARDEHAFKPANYNEAAIPQSSSGIAMVNALVSGGIALARLDSDDPELGGCWILEISPEH